MSDNDFRPQTLPEQLLELWVRSGFPDHRREWLGVLGWMLAGGLAFGLGYAWLLANSAGWIPSTLAVGRTGMMASLFIYTVQRSVIVTGLVHLVLWSEWHSSRPSLKQLLVGSAAMSFFCSTLQHPIFLTAIAPTLWIRAFANYLLTIGWYVMLFRAASAWFAYELVPANSEPKARSHRDRTAYRGWTVSGMLLSTTLVAITIVTKQWIHTHFIETAPSSTPGYSVWINLASEMTNILDAFLLAYAAAALLSRRHIMIPISIIAASFAIHCVVSLFITEMLPTFYVRPEFIDLLYSISLSIFATLAMQWAAFRAWRWAGYEVHPVRSRQPSVSSTG
ncbi:MAG: hypothetical protein ACF8CQ_23480 [Rhodopirellula sp. JB044]|uniref:hypothetical protein n=1 Tax=Rhodopirellula sp. JB044 TaxID=3342844 RepID=UPI00370A1CF4